MNRLDEMFSEINDRELKAGIADIYEGKRADENTVLKKYAGMIAEKLGSLEPSNFYATVHDRLLQEAAFRWLELKAKVSKQKTYTLFFVTGKSKVVKSLNVIDAIKNKSGFGEQGYDKVDFWIEGDVRSLYEFDEPKKEWKRIFIK